MIPFSVSEAMQSGFFISGTRQMSGKTNLAKHLTWILMCEGISVYVFDVSQAWLHNTPISDHVRIPNGRGTLQIGERHSKVFDMSALTLAERLAFVNNFALAVYQSHVAGYKSPEMLIFEEAQTYLPNGCMRSLRKYTSVVDYITVGGNYNTSFGLVTQFPAMVDKTPVKAAQQRYFGLTTEYNDVQYVRSFIGKERIAELKNLKLGEFLYQNKGKIERFQCDKYGAFIKSDAEKNWFNVKAKYDVEPLALSYF